MVPRADVRPDPYLMGSGGWRTGTTVAKPSPPADQVPVDCIIRTNLNARLTILHSRRIHAETARMPRVFGLVAERAAARRYVIPDESGSEEERAAGGPGLEPPILSRR